MKTLLDTMVIAYALERKDALGDWARNIVAQAVAGDGALVNPISVAEAMVGAEDPETITPDLELLGVDVCPLPQASAKPAALAYLSYLQKSKDAGERNKTPLPDFFIGAHAATAGLAVATNDKRRFKTYFKSVPLVLPPAAG